MLSSAEVGVSEKQYSPNPKQLDIVLKFKNECIGEDLFKQTRNKKEKDKYYFKIHDIKEYRETFNKLEEYDYEYEDYDYFSDCDSEYED